MSSKWLVCCLAVITGIALSGCKVADKNSGSPAGSSNAADSNSGSATAGVEKVKPAAGKGNLQGKVFYNSKPVENIEVRLCETFNQYFGGCGGKIYTARTDKE